MMTFEQIYDHYCDLTKDPTTTNLARGKNLINWHQEKICGLKDFNFKEKERTGTSVASQQYYRLPVDYDVLLAVWVTVGGVNYWPTEVSNMTDWQSLNQTSVSSDITTQFAIIEKYVHFYPIFSSTSGTIHILYKRRPIEMSQADYVTGTVSNTAGTRTVTGSGTTFSSAMEGRWIKLAGEWYEVQTVGSTTSLTLYDYTIKGAVSETTHIGEVSIIPEEFHDLLWLGPVADYYDFKGEPNPWRLEYEKRLAMFIRKYEGGRKSTYQVMRRGDKTRGENPNDYPTGLTG